MTVYTATASGALATLKRKGAAVTFTLTIPGTLDPVTETYSGGSETTVTGYAIRDRGGDPQRYAALELIQSQAPRLLFASTTLGSLPPMNSVTTWGGEPFTVRDVDPIEPDGTALVAYIIIGR